ncbi:MULTISPECIES: hypothetical protein [unclassified Moorena]|nr:MULTISPECIES: hypothetical protein [unclassified Moorena]
MVQILWQLTESARGEDAVRPRSGFPTSVKAHLENSLLALAYD